MFLSWATNTLLIWPFASVRLEWRSFSVDTSLTASATIFSTRPLLLLVCYKKIMCKKKASPVWSTLTYLNKGLSNLQFMQLCVHNTQLVLRGPKWGKKIIPTLLHHRQNRTTLSCSFGKFWPIHLMVQQIQKVIRPANQFSIFTGEHI